jgi:hypothetical protein
LTAGTTLSVTGKAQLLPFTVTVPAKTSPGQYIGGFAAWIAAPTKHVTGSIGLQVQTRLVNAIVVTVPGTLKSAFTVSGAGPVRLPHGIYVQAHIRNSGNTLL